MPFSPLARALALTATLAMAGLSAQTAHAAAPIKSPFPKKAGRLAAASCPERPLSTGGIPRGREYLGAVMKCLDKSWAAYVRKAGRSLGRPVVRYFDEPQRTVCGMPWPEHAAAFYCTERATLVFPLTGSWIEGRTDLYPMKVAAHEYGHHVQSALGIRKAYEMAARARRERDGDLKRRYELQADCLAGVFLGSVWGSLGRPQRDWAALLDTVKATGDEDGERSHGKGASRASWLERGFRSGSPATCDTWSATAAKVS
ncbi:neutral zinc metallopeptidase [Nonomuraea sp. NPDC050643]|uniref:neutral zinc metallopeptidase n=1 Tax=Nonomuraea sp. NPDC050643 TaxID=3155660 RepID=UPI00340B888E